MKYLLIILAGILAGCANDFRYSAPGFGAPGSHQLPVQRYEIILKQE